LLTEDRPDLTVDVVGRLMAPYAVFNWAYTVVDLRFGYDDRWGDVDVRPFVGIDNVFNERYNSSAITNAFGRRYYEPSPDREIYAGFTLRFGTS
jgi:iron complex outermembrane receptor protein